MEQISQAPILSIENLSISFGGLKAVNDLSFEIYEKEIFGLIGPNGAGKTTVFNCITQFYRPDHGIIRFTNKRGENVILNNHPVHDIIRQGIVRTFQNVELIRELSIIDNVLVGAHIDYRHGVFSEMFALPGYKKEEKQYYQQALEVLEFMGIAHLKDYPVGAQPYGVCKKTEIARTLMAKPKLIILDEPAAGLNETETKQLADEIYRMRDLFNCTILLVEHDMGLVMKVCDRICAMSFGKQLATGTPEFIKKNRAVQEAYLGVDE